jgi:voltage-dependent calcium channel L type alpha-1D
MFWFIIILVFLNTCVLATEHYRQPEWLDHFQVNPNLVSLVNHWQEYPNGREPS